MKKYSMAWIAVAMTGLLFLVGTVRAANADQTSATISALRMAGTVTGGLMPSSAPEFTKMVSYIMANDYFDAAMTAANSKYASSYLARRIAKEMQNPQLTTAGVPDNDATTFIVANLLGSGTTANISKLWSDDATYMIKTTGTCNNAAKSAPPCHALDLTAAQLAAVNWQTDLVRVAGQQAKDTAGAALTIPQKDVGGYMTLSDRVNDSSYAQYGFTSGTNLRAIEGMYEISMGLTLPEMVVLDGQTPAVAPRFVPEQDPNFFVGQGQSACISCHGGGASNLTHGYAALADKYDFSTTKGLTYIAAPTTSTMKSLGSTPGNRASVLTCNLAKFTTCNPDSQGADPNQSWDLSTWQQGGLLSQMGWEGPIMGQGLNSLGQAVGQASLVFQYMVDRVIGEICPLGSIGASQIASIAKQAQAADSFAYIVASVASDASCR